MGEIEDEELPPPSFSMHVQHLHSLCSLQAAILVQNALTVGQHVITYVAITGI